MTGSPGRHLSIGAPIIHNAAGRWFTPGKGGSEWFKDHEHGPDMVVVPAGRFAMGSTISEIAALAAMSGEGDTGAYRDGSAEAHPGGSAWWQTEAPRHEVTIAEPLAVGRHAVTLSQFAAFAAQSGHEPELGAHVWTGTTFAHDPVASWRAPGFVQDGRHPVVGVSWYDAQAYAAWLSAKTGQNYRLLTEAEREYVTRAGTTTLFWWGDLISSHEANFDGRVPDGGGSPGEYRARTVPAGSFAPNPWGLYQVHGNVWEWCEDGWHPDYAGAPVDGSARPAEDIAVGQNRRVIRGGSWVLYPTLLRSANRLYNPAAARSHDLGFRLARSVAV